MRSKFPCRVCGKKSANSGFVNPGLREQCICRPCYAKQIRTCLQNIGVHVETQSELSTMTEGGMYTYNSYIFVLVVLCIKV